MSINTEKLEQLHKTYDQVIEWVKFAEAKNGALIAFGGAVIFGATRVVRSAENVPPYVMIYFALFCLLAATSALIAIMSFIPGFSLPWASRIAEQRESDNPLYFGDACKYSKESYLALFNSRIRDNSTGVAVGLEMELCEQIVVNSRVAFKKYRMFTIGVWIFLAAVLTPLGALLIWLAKE